MAPPSALVVGGGFAGVACAKHLAKHGVPVTLIDRHDYNQFQPLLYQVATAQVETSDVARPLRSMFSRREPVQVKMADVTAMDPAAKTVTSADGVAFSADYLVVAVGAEPNFFDTPGADTQAFPLYSVNDAERLRSRVLTVVEEAHRNPTLIEQGALNFVVVGAGATGVETAGALADAINRRLPELMTDDQVRRASVTVVDPASVVLAPFSARAHEYAKNVLEQRGVQLELGVKVTEIKPDRVLLSDGRDILTRTVVWAGGIKAAMPAGSGLPLASSGRVEVGPDLEVAGFPGVYALGDVANTLGSDGKPLPQLGSVALQAGRCAAVNILADIAGTPHEQFHYRDKGIMAMIGRNAAVAEVGTRRRELHGALAYASWLGVHAWLLSGMRTRLQAIGSWGWDYVANTRASAYINRPEAARIDWDDEQSDSTG